MAVFLGGGEISYVIKMLISWLFYTYSHGIFWDKLYCCLTEPKANYVKLVNGFSGSMWWETRKEVTNLSSFILLDESR